MQEEASMSIQDLRERRGVIANSLEQLAQKPNFSASIDQPKYDKLMSDLDKVDHEIGAYQRQNERIVAAARGVTRNTADAQEHLDAFKTFLRSPKDMRAQQALRELDVRNLSTGATDPAGGFLVPELLLEPLMARAVNANPFRDLVRVINVASRDIVIPLSNSNSTTGWIGESGTRALTAEATLVGARPTFGTLYAFVEATEELVADSVFSIGDWFAQEAGAAMGEAEMAAVISGTGTNQPSGLLLTPPTTGADGTRAATVLKYLPTGNAATLGANPSDLLISTIYDVRGAYRSNATWVMNSATVATIRQLKDAQGRFLWTDGITQGEPSTLLGYPVRIAEAMPGVAANNFPILFGDFSRAYVSCDLGGLRVTLDDNITVPGRYRWYIRRRVGGIVYDNNAVRAIRVSVT
jgi:HK97 family phage major capsid protein